MLEHNVEQKGGTMRLGERVSVFKDMPEGQTSMMRVMYGNQKGTSRRNAWSSLWKFSNYFQVLIRFLDGWPSWRIEISERHRHRFEVNPALVETFEKNGLHFVATCPNNERMEILELSREDHPFFVACQYHPEFLSRPLKPSPPFLGLMLAACGELNDYLAKL